MKLFFIFLMAIILLILSQLLGNKNYWEIKSIDTIKYSRDLSREKLNDKNFEKEIEKQVKEIAKTGATHVAIGTPYDEEFLPYMREWIQYARIYNLNVWFRGNWSGWEGWFNYPKINKNEHINKTKNFILKNPDLFENGDIFTSCTECENGLGIDPRITKDYSSYREFIINEYEVTKSAFKQINKQVKSNYYSMNGDVALLVMDKETTKNLNGVVVIDHYVETPEQLKIDIETIINNSGGKVILGEFGAPIPQIHGDMSEFEQAKWVNKSLELISKMPKVIGINYWSNVGSSTEIWSQDISPRAALIVLKSFF